MAGLFWFGRWNSEFGISLKNLGLTGRGRSRGIFAGNINRARASFLSHNVIKFTLNGTHSALGQNGELRIRILFQKLHILLVRYIVVSDTIRCLGFIEQGTRRYVDRLARYTAQRNQCPWKTKVI